MLCRKKICGGHLGTRHAQMLYIFFFFSEVVSFLYKRLALNKVGLLDSEVTQFKVDYLYQLRCNFYGNSWTNIRIENRLTSIIDLLKFFDAINML